MTVVVALGANLGDRESTLRSAVADVAAIPGVFDVVASRPVESVAVTTHGLDDTKPTYLNAVLTLETSREPHDLLDELQRIENAHGRVREERWGDRTLDLDVIAIDDLTLDTDRLTVPHPRAGDRSFVLEPWLEIDRDAHLPGLGPVAVIAATLDDAVVIVAGSTPLHLPTPTQPAPTRPAPTPGVS